MKLPTITNCSLTRVTSPGLEAEWDRPAAPGPEVWSGTERVLCIEIDEDRTRASRGDLGLPVVDQLLDRTMVIDAALLEFEVGYGIEFQIDGQDAEVGIVRWRRRTTTPGVPGVTRIILRRA